MLFKMQSLMIALAIFSVASAQQGVSKSARGAPPLILKQTSEVHPDGSYEYSYETENGIRAQESGDFNLGPHVEGSYSYTAPDGTPIMVTYVADVDGFHPVGAHLPVAPEIPPLIAKALAYIASKSGVDDDNKKQRYFATRPQHPQVNPLRESPGMFNTTARPRPEPAYTPGPQYAYPAVATTVPSQGFHSGTELK